MDDLELAAAAGELAALNLNDYLIATPENRLIHNGVMLARKWIETANKTNDERVWNPSSWDIEEDDDWICIVCCGYHEDCTCDP